MLKSRLGFPALLLACLFGLGVVLGLFLPRWTGFGRGPAVYNTAALLQQVKTVSELSTVQFVIEKVVVLEVPPEGMLAQMFAGENRVLLLAHGIVKAGIDLGRVQPADFQVSDHKITLKLPPAQIIDAYLDDKQTCVIERTTGRFRSFDKNLEQAARQQAVDDIRRAARSGGILKEAEDRARAQLTNLFRQLGFQQVEIRP
jgi:hypothetical protein